METPEDKSFRRFFYITLTDIRNLRFIDLTYTFLISYIDFSLLYIQLRNNYLNEEIIVISGRIA